jgi:excisionase family DNA binding protein
MAESVLWTVAEVAELLRVSRWTIYRMVRAGKLQPIPPVGGKILFRADDIDALLTGAEVAA